MSHTEPDDLLYNAKDPDEDLSYGMDFTNLLGSGETISTASVTVSTYVGTDASPSALLAASPAISSPIVYQRISGGLEGVTYRIKYRISTNQSRVLVAAGYLPVDAP